MEYQALHEAMTFWKQQSIMYEKLWLEQRTIADSYQRICERQECFIARMELNKTLDKKIAKSECI